MDNQELFEKTPVKRALLKLALPTIISQLILLLYNLADTFFIGRTGNPYMVAAVSLMLPVYNICLAFANLYGVGGGSLISRLLGVKRHDEAKKVCAYSFYKAILAAGLFSLAILIFMDPLLRFLGASDQTVEFARQYAFYTIVIGAIPSVLTITMANLIRSVGCASQAATGNSLGCLLNIALDPLFMFVILPKGMEVQGAAIATMLSNVIAMIYFLFQFKKLKKTTSLSLSIHEGKPDHDSIRAIYAVGIPSGLSMLLYDITNIVIDKLSAGYGDIAVAAIGIVLKAERVPLNIGVGICMGMMPLAAYNYSSGNRKRMHEVLSFSRILGISISLLCIVLYEVFAGLIMQIFINDATTIAYGVQFLRARCLASVVMFMCFNYVFFLKPSGRVIFHCFWLWSGSWDLISRFCSSSIIFWV
ncbi:MAG: MATE family efflux transporter [Eubacteriaceae bacterium]|jgi:multidrug efflux pump